MALSFLVGHLADHQRTALHLLTDRLEFLGPFLLGPLALGFHTLTVPTVVAPSATLGGVPLEQSGWALAVAFAGEIPAESPRGLWRTDPT
jgi:hypothetical protein